MARAFAIAFLAAAFCAATPAAAQDEKDGKVAEILDGFLSEQRVAMTCSTLDQPSHKSVVGLWELFSADVMSLLEQGGVSLARRAAFAAEARSTKLILPDTLSFGEVRRFCDGDPDWARRIAQSRSYARYTELRRLLGQ